MIKANIIYYDSSIDMVVTWNQDKQFFVFNVWPETDDDGEDDPLIFDVDEFEANAIDEHHAREIAINYLENLKVEMSDAREI